ncbi:MAG: branched-chain amino acid transport system substrate-binding protein, partial [Mycobacterium sp.]|nr:branched-chain amino acid transport system substrate-binding protein [Mycobacterium sp.]
MRGRVARNAFAIGSAGVILLGVSGCNQSTPEEEASQTNLKIVEQVQIDANGAEVKPDASAGPAVDPAGDGKAVCPPLQIAMAGALNGPDAALGINIKNGAQLAVDKHNAANPGCQVQLQPFDTEGDPEKAKG